MSEPGWDWCWGDEDGILVRVNPVRVYYDKSAGRWACVCERYRDRGRCGHLTRWRPTVTIWALDIYL